MVTKKKSVTTTIKDYPLKNNFYAKQDRMGRCKCYAAVSL